MKHHRCLFPLIVIVAGTLARAQDIVLDADYQARIVATANQLLTANYVFPDVAQQAAAAVSDHLKNGDYNGITSAAAFADRLTRDYNTVAHDKHLGVHYAYQGFAPGAGGGGPGNPAVAHELNDLFKAVSRLDGNIGYLRVDGFTDPATAADTAAAAFNFLANTEALVIDLRYNGGGNPVMVAYLESYLFDHRVHVNDIYFRSTNSTTSYYTEDQVPGKRYLGRDVYILTSRDTISGGEGFAYEMRAEKRAETVGEITAGGANPGQIQRIDDNFGIFVPFGRVINPVTGTNWEGVGVTPDIASSADLALKVAQLAALQKLISDGHDRPPDLVAEMKSTADQLQKDITAARIVSNRCPEVAAPAIHAVTDANYGDHVTAAGTMIVWGAGFTAGGGNSLQFTGEGSGSATLSGTDGSYFWDASDNQINAAVDGRLTQGQWAVVVQNACGVSSAPFPITIQ